MDPQKDIDASGLSNASPFVKQVIETMNLRPDLLQLSPFALQCMDYRGQRRRPTSPKLSGVSQLSGLTLLSATTVVSAYAVSDYERTSYYNGITDWGDHPDLLYRTGSAKYPWIQPEGRFPYQPIKSLRGVYRTPLNDVWSTVGPQVSKLVKDRMNRFSIDPARFVTHGEDGEETLGPVVIWVGVYPGSTSADTAHEVSQNILELLEKNGVKDVEVEWHEAVLWKAGGAGGPALLRVVNDINPTVHVRRHLTAALGMPISIAEREMDDGSVGFFFHEGRDKHGNPSTKVFGVSSRHVLLEKIERTFEFGRPGAPRKYVRVNGFRRFQRGLDEIKVSISEHGILADLYTRKIIELEAKGATEDEEDPEEEDPEELLRNARERLDEHKRATINLEKFYDDVTRQWTDIEFRNIGHIHYSPPISVDVKGEQYTEDWGTFELYEAKFKAQFKGNVVNLGTAIAPWKLTAMMYSQSDEGMTFKYPADRQLRINGVVTRELLANPGLYDSEGQPCLIVLKDGCATDLTVGRYAGLESFLCDENGVESIELAIYNYNQKEGVFSAKGDSGSLIFDGLGRMVGLLHSGKSKGGSASAYITYATPAWWLIGRIKAKYPHADFNRTTW